MNPTRTLIVFVGLLVAGCEPMLDTGSPEPVPDALDDVAACIAEYSVANGYDHYSDNRLDIGFVEEMCENADGTDCASAAYITREAAECIADAGGLSEGIYRWSVSIYFNRDFGLPAWDLYTTTWDDGWEWGGEVVTVHATTGELLESDEWTEVEEDDPG